MNEEIPKLNQDFIDAVLAYIPILSDPSFAFGEWRMPQGQFPHYFFNVEADQFVDALSRLMIVFDWPAWKEEATGLMKDPKALADVDLLTLRKLITTHLRAERFNEGHLASQFKNGHLLAVLQRLEELREHT